MPIGIFDGHADVGAVLRSGRAAYDPAERSYSVAGSGENMWSTRDAFHYVWKEARGDIALTADVSFPEPGREPHRKACLVIRQSLDPDSAYADAALHGDGLTSLQFRNTEGGTTHEVQANVSAAPARLGIEKRGDYVRLFVADAAGKMRFSGAATGLAFREPFYIGLGVCSHSDEVTEIATFLNVVLDTDLPATTGGQPGLYSALETQTIASTDRRVCFVTPTHIEAPNWLADATALIFNSGGRLHRIPVAGGTPETIDTGFATRCNNDHGVSPDGTRLVISD